MSVLDDIAAERSRQIEAEGWTAAHDDEHRNGELANAAACYAATVTAFRQIHMNEGRGRHVTFADLWPEGWDAGWWKPKGRRRDLVRAAALIVAEIERLDRAELRRGGDKR